MEELKHEVLRLCCSYCCSLLCVFRELLLGVSANRNLKGIYLDVSSNELGPAGASYIMPCLATCSGVRGLDLSNNGEQLQILESIITLRLLG